MDIIVGPCNAPGKTPERSWREILSGLVLPEPPGYSVERDFPYRIRDNSPAALTASTSDIAVLDSAGKLQWPQSDGRCATASHYTFIRTLFGFDPVRTAFDISMESYPGNIDTDKTNAVLTYLIQNHQQEKIRVVCRPVGVPWSFDAINELVKTYSPGKEQNLELTPDNIVLYPDLIRNVLKNYVAADPTDFWGKRTLEEARLVQALIDRGVAVVDSAGNNGPANINLLHALVPDIIVTGGLNGNSPHPDSSNSSLVDYWAPYEHKIQLPEDEILIEGTSFTVPPAAIETSKLLKTGLSIRQINQLFRERQCSVSPVF